MANNIMNENFMYLAELISKKSPDPHTKVGAVIVSKDNEELSFGYNNLPKGFDPKTFNWNRTSDKKLETKYPFVIHAEANAICNFKGERSLLEGSTIYVTLFPCNECAKKIVSYGIKEVYYLSDKYHDSEDTIASRMILDRAGVTYTQVTYEEEKAKIPILKPNNM